MKNSTDFYEIFQFAIFLIIQLLLLPLTVIGYIVLVAKVMRYSKKHGLSLTSTRPLGSRWILHLFGLREDETMVKMVASLPHISKAALWLTMEPAVIAHRICGYIPKIARIPQPEKATLMSFLNCRTEFFDKTKEKNINSMDQVVFMGAGFDTRAFKYCKEKNIKVFELDKENTQKCKIEAFEKARIDHEWITFVPVDFNKESWADKLIEYGYDTSKKTFFLWEGVTIYLEEESIKQTLQAVARSSGKGSIITFDFFSKAIINGEGSWIMSYYWKKMAKMAGEPFKFGIDVATDPKKNVEKLLDETGLSLDGLALIGKTTKKEKPFGGLVEAIKI